VDNAFGIITMQLGVEKLTKKLGVTTRVGPYAAIFGCVPYQRISATVPNAGAVEWGMKLQRFICASYPLKDNNNFSFKIKISVTL